MTKMRKEKNIGNKPRHATNKCGREGGREGGRGERAYRLEGKMASPVYVKPAASNSLATRARRASSLGEGVKTFCSSPLGSSTTRPETVVKAAAASWVLVCVLCCEGTAGRRKPCETAAKARTRRLVLTIFA